VWGGHNSRKHAGGLGSPLAQLTAVSGCDCCQHSRCRAGPSRQEHLGMALVLTECACACGMWWIRDPLGRGWVGRLDGASGASTVDGECQKWHLLRPGKPGRRKVKK